MKDYFQLFETGDQLNPMGVSSEPFALATFLCLLHCLLSDHFLGCFSLHSLLISFSHTIAAKTLLTIAFQWLAVSPAYPQLFPPKLLVFNREMPHHPRPTMKTFPTQETKQPEPRSHFSIEPKSGLPPPDPGEPLGIILRGFLGGVELWTKHVRNAHWVRLDLSWQLMFQPPILSLT